MIAPFAVPFMARALAELVLLARARSRPGSRPDRLPVLASFDFEDGKLAGWDLDGRENGKFATGNGIGIGMTRKALEAAAGSIDVGETSIGNEFTAGGVSGLLSTLAPDGKVTNLWAGVTCIAR